jgi:hypothetical protein
MVKFDNAPPQRRANLPYSDSQAPCVSVTPRAVQAQMTGVKIVRDAILDHFTGNVKQLLPERTTIALLSALDPALSH